MKGNPYAKKHTLAKSEDEDQTNNAQKPSPVSTKPRARKLRVANLTNDPKCVICGVCHSPQWRHVGETIRCNACYLHYKIRVNEESASKKKYKPLRRIFPDDFLNASPPLTFGFDTVCDINQ